jgi:pSer/pThr/pTyr-binding forkhead associated (FHA) protein
MAKLVLLSAGLAGRTYELKVEKTTVGRVEDNAFQVAEPSVSSHHCEIILRGSDVVVRDLNSTNGTFINGEKVAESALKLGQVLRLGQIEMRLEPDGPSGASSTVPATLPASAPSTAPAPSSGSTTKKLDQTMVMQRGVSLTDLEQGSHGGGFDAKGTGFAKKDNKVNLIFIVAGVVLGVVIVGLLLYVYSVVHQAPGR